MGFTPDLYEWQADLSAAVADLRDKGPTISLMRDYYSGSHPKVWLTDKIREMFDALAEELGKENWCPTVVDQPVRRLHVEDFDGDASASALFIDADLDRDQGDLYTDVYVTGEAFLVASDAPGGVQVDINDPAEVSWPKTRKRAPRVVTKVWADQDEQRWRATLFYEVDVVRLTGPKLDVGMLAVPDASAFHPDEDDPGGEHGFDGVPVIRFALDRAGTSRLQAVQRTQDRINKLVANKMVAAEFGAFHQRWFLTTQTLDDGAVDARPDRAVVLDPGGGDGVSPTSVGTFPATELANYDRSIDAEIDKLFSIATLPRHLKINTGTALSGDAIRADEGPFVEMVKNAQSALGASWSDLFDLLGWEAVPVWADANTSDPELEFKSVTAAVNAGVPLDVALRYLAGWNEQQIAECNKPDTVGQIAGHLTSLGTAASLGAIDPEVVRTVSSRMLGVTPPTEE